MIRVPAALVVACTAWPVATASADPMSIGGWIGPRFFSDDAALGYIVEAPEHPHLENGMVLGFRVGWPILPWLVPEAELPLTITGTDSFDATVLWLEPRAHVRFEFVKRRERVRPFVLLGGGAPIALSNKTGIFDTDIVGDGYFGVGTHVSSGRGFQLRADFRVSLGPGVEKRAILEFEAGIGLWFELGKSAEPVRGGDEAVAADEATGDPDRDGIVGKADGCPSRAEDRDEFEDSDGCPDIDNDLDQVLDIADKCPSEMESLNGYDDDDGCPDQLPAEVEGIVGTIAGLNYDPGKTTVKGGAGKRQVQKIANVLTKYPAVRIKLVGHTDDREAGAAGAAGAKAAGGAKAEPAPEMEPAPDGGGGAEPAAAAAPADAPAAAGGTSPLVELALQRAGGVKALLVSFGVDESRVAIEGKGADDPVGDNTTKRGRQANRRVVLERVVPGK